MPAEIRPGYIFHATDLHYGGKHRQTWPEADRWALLDRLVALPRQMGIPVAMGFTPKPDIPQIKKVNMSILSHAVAYALCLKAMDDLMVRHVPANEVAMVVAEERPEAHKALKLCQKLFSDEAMMTKYVPSWTKFSDGPITRIKAPPNFAAKDEEILLQMADACAFVFQRALNGAPGSERLLTAMCGGLPDLSALEGEVLGCAAFNWLDD